MQDWITQNYSNILEWASNITKSDALAEDLAHYSIERFMTHPRYEEILSKEYDGTSEEHCRPFLLAIMRNSWFSKKSEFARYYKAHRADLPGTRKKNIEEEQFNHLLEQNQEEEYNYNKDFLIEAIEGILEEMEIDTKKHWYTARLFRLYLEHQNFSKIARDTGIPRTSISNAVEEAKEYIKQELKKRNIDYDF